MQENVMALARWRGPGRQARGVRRVPKAAPDRHEAVGGCGSRDPPHEADRNPIAERFHTLRRRSRPSRRGGAPLRNTAYLKRTNRVVFNLFTAANGATTRLTVCIAKPRGAEQMVKSLQGYRVALLATTILAGSLGVANAATITLYKGGAAGDWATTGNWTAGLPTAALGVGFNRQQQRRTTQVRLRIGPVPDRDQHEQRRRSSRLYAHARRKRIVCPAGRRRASPARSPLPPGQAR